MFQGWKNYETWVTALWISNDYHLCQSISDVIESEGDAEKYIKEIIEEHSPRIDGLYDDLLQSSIAKIDYREIVENYAD